MTSGRGRKEFYQLAGLLYPRSSFAEAYRTLRTNIEFASLDTPVRTLLVTSSAPGEGKTVTAANLAIVFAQSGRTVILVDADLRKPGVDSIFGLPNTRGLTDLLRHQSINVDAVANATEQDNLRVVTTGPLPPNPAELLGSKRMQTVVQRLQQAADLVIFDSPPLLAVTDAAVMGSFLEGTLLVIDAARGRRRLVRMGREALSRSGANTLGAVLNRVPAVTRFGYGAYYGRGEESAPAVVVDVVAERRGSFVDPAAGSANVQVPREARARISANRSRSVPRS
jgi:non-specific protein-tyrosine kinase